MEGLRAAAVLGGGRRTTRLANSPNKRKGKPSNSKQNLLFLFGFPWSNRDFSMTYSDPNRFFPRAPKTRSGCKKAT
jgi:hypothetical protein